MNELLKAKFAAATRCIDALTPEQSAQITRTLLGVPEVAAISSEKYALVSVNNRFGDMFMRAVYWEHDFEVEIGEFHYEGDSCTVTFTTPMVLTLDPETIQIASDGQNVVQVLGGALDAEALGWDGSENYDPFEIAKNVMTTMSEADKDALTVSIKNFIENGIEAGRFPAGDNFRLGLLQEEDGTPWLVATITLEGVDVSESIPITAFHFNLVKSEPESEPRTPKGSWQWPATESVKNEPAELTRLAGWLGTAKRWLN